ncbi:MAG: hypothetical protein U0271_22415 [Polyangiaceae bacterium]
MTASPFTGKYEIVSIEADGQNRPLFDVFASQNQRLVFARMVLEFEPSRLSVVNQLLQSDGTSYQACDVKASADAAWAGDLLSRALSLSADASASRIAVNIKDNEASTQADRLACSVSLILNRGARLERVANSQEVVLTVDFEGRTLRYHLAPIKDTTVDFAKLAERAARSPAP